MELLCLGCGAALQAGDGGLVCPTCARRYPVIEGVPVVLPPEMTAQHAHQKAYFDSQFSGYESYAVDNWRRSFNERIFRAIRVEPDWAPYLDVGVGGSGATVIEAGRAGVWSVGCDLSVEGVVRASRFASEEVPGRTDFVVCMAEELPFRSGSIGAASIVAVLEHLDDDALAVSELARVLRDGGRVWATVPHAYRHMPLPVWPVYWAHDRRIGHKRHYDERRLRQLFEQSGFRHVETQYSGHPVKLLQTAATVVRPALRSGPSDWWWRLERRDLRLRHKARGALQISAVFEKPASSPSR